jgi:hypothetical protein
MTKKKLLIGALLSLIITTFFLQNLIFNIKQPLGYFYTDAGHGSFILKNNIEKIIHLDFSRILTLPMFYGYRYSLFNGDNFLLQSVMALPIYLITGNPVMAFNIFITLTVFISFFSMYCFILYMTKQILPSVLAGILFVFNPFIMVIFPDALGLFSLYWIPLLFLSFEKYLKDKKDDKIIFIFLFLILQLLSSVYYFVFLSTIFFIYAFVRIRQEKFLWKKAINKKFFLSISIFSLVFIGIFYLYYLNNSFNISIETFIEIVRYNYSPYLLNWLTTSPSNILYGKMSETIQNFVPAFFSRRPNDMINLFFGVTPLLVFLFSFPFLKKSHWKKYWQLCLTLIGLSSLFSFGPYIQLTNYFAIINIPYFIYRFIPLFSFIRVPARLTIFTFFFLSLIIALTLTEISKKISDKKFLTLMVIIIILTIFEYRFYFYNVPVFSVQTNDFYKYLKEDKNIKVILDYPIGNRLPEYLPDSRNETKEGRYLFLTLFHNKILLNGYGSYLPDDYVVMANYLSVDFPQKSQLQLLRDKGVDAIILHKNEFTDPEQFSKIRDKLLFLKVPLVKSTDDLALFTPL